MSNPADDVRDAVETATTISSSDDTEVYHHGDMMAVVEQRGNDWNVRVYRGNSEGDAIWEKNYDNRTSAEAGGKSAMYQLERESNGQAQSYAKGNTHAQRWDSEENWDEVDWWGTEGEAVREGQHVRVFLDKETREKGYPHVLNGVARDARTENGSFTINYDGTAYRIDLFDEVVKIETRGGTETIGGFTRVTRPKTMGEPRAAPVRAAAIPDSEDDPWESVQPNDVREGDDVRLLLGPAAASEMGKDMVGGSVSHASGAEVHVELWNYPPVIWDVSNRLLDEDRNVLGVVERALRLRGMGAEHAKVGPSGMKTRNPTEQYSDEALRRKYEEWAGRPGALYRSAAFLAEMEMRDRGMSP